MNMCEELTNLTWLSSMTALQKGTPPNLKRRNFVTYTPLGYRPLRPTGPVLQAALNDFAHSEVCSAKSNGHSNTQRDSRKHSQDFKVHDSDNPSTNNYTSRRSKSKQQNGEYPRPSCSYSCLIAMALKACSTGCLPVHEIYRFIEQEYPFYKTAPEGWKNSIRHNLSMNQNFMKVARPDGIQTKKGFYWAINPSRMLLLDQEIDRSLKAMGRKLIENGCRPRGYTYPFFSGEGNQASSMLQQSCQYQVPTRYSPVQPSTATPTFAQAQYIPYCENMAMYFSSGSSSFSSSVSSGYSYPIMDEQTSDNLKTLNSIAGLETRMKPSNTPEVKFPLPHVRSDREAALNLFGDSLTPDVNIDNILESKLKQRQFKPTHFRVPISADCLPENSLPFYNPVHAYQSSSTPSNTEEEIILWGYDDKVQGLNHTSADSGHSHTNGFGQPFNTVEIEQKDSSQCYPEWVAHGSMVSNGHHQQCMFESAVESNPDVVTQTVPLLNHIVYCNGSQATNSHGSFDRAVAPVNPYGCTSTYSKTSDSSSSDEEKTSYEIQVQDNDSLQDVDECCIDVSSQAAGENLKSLLENGSKLSYGSEESREGHRGVSSKSAKQN